MGDITEDKLKDELTKEFGVEGTGYIINTINNGKQWKIIVKGIEYDIDKPAALAELGNNKIKLNVLEDVATESRASIIKVSATVETITKEEYISSEQLRIKEEIRNLNMEDLGNYYSSLMTNGYTTTFTEMYSSAPFNTIDDYYDNYGPKSSGNYEDVYDFVVKSASSTLGNQYNNKYTSISININGESKYVTANTENYAEFIVLTNGTHKISAFNQNGDTGHATANVTKCKIETFSDIMKSNYILSKDGYEVVIPAGFAYGTSVNVGTVTKGLVITDSVDENNNSTGNEFVWIPIDKTNLTVGKTEKQMAIKTSGTDIKGNENYQGALYEQWTDTATYIPTNHIIREPAYLTDSTHGDDNNFNKDSLGNKIVTEASMQEDYNAMIKSIKENGGFYIARYEMGKDSNYSKVGAVPTSAANRDEKTWYGLYCKAKNYKSPNGYDSIVSSMIWDSQYDAMLNFVLTNSEDKAKVTATGNGNNTKVVLKTGIYTGNEDSLNNIFDLAGNMREWTMGRYSNTSRTIRGNSYIDSSVSPSKKDGSYYSDLISANFGTRLSMYIK